MLKENNQRKIAHVELKLETCDWILRKPGWKMMIALTLREQESFDAARYACKAAEEFDFDVSELLFSCVDKAPLEYSGLVRLLYRSGEYARKATKVYEEKLPLAEIASGMGDILGFGTESSAEGCLDLVLQELCLYPGLGIPLIKTGLHSPVIRNRNSACNVLESWVKALKEGVRAFAPELADALTVLAEEEVDEGMKGRIARLLES